MDPARRFAPLLRVPASARADNHSWLSKDFTVPIEPHPAQAPSAQQVFEILAREHADMLTAFLRSLAPRADLVDDLFQETMLVAWRRLPEYDRSLPFGPWLRGIAGKLILESRRKTAKAMVACEPEMLQALEAEFRRFERSPADSFRQRMERLSACLEKLPPLMRDAIDLVYARGLSLKGLAASLSASEEAIKKRIQRARALLAQCLETTGGSA
jgi:RNA polymerase sigma-70 factor